MDDEMPQMAADATNEQDTDERSGLAGVAASIAGAAGPVIEGARRLIDERPGARVRRVRRMAREPLVNLWDLHPDARRAAIRELGLQTVPVDKIAGTAVEGPPQRGGDFLPLPDRRSVDWRSRWQRILDGVEHLASMPPVELIKFGDTYWVVDGHNRVAAALYTGQGEIDAIVQEFRLPGMPTEPPVRIAQVLDGSLDLRDAGAGRLTRTFDRPTNRLPRNIQPHDHEAPDDQREADHEPDTDREPQG